jgi:hypothetical protein
VFPAGHVFHKHTLFGNIYRKPDKVSSGKNLPEFPRFSS